MERIDRTRQLLQGAQPVGARENAHRERMLGLCEAAGDPFDRARLEPGHFTASGFVLSPTGDALLLIHHKKLGRWLQPGGHVEPDDGDLLGAALREVREEVGVLDLSPLLPQPYDLDVHTIPAHGGVGTHEHFDVRFLLRAQSLELQTSDEVAGARWVPLAELTAEPADASVQRVARKLLQG
ncbi:MAG: NUDIX hydrolase [Myxococcales bacterium]|nr:NUDIX hydrolase [Myxococcales bacterium]